MNKRLMIVTFAFAAIGIFSSAKTLSTYAVARGQEKIEKSQDKFRLPKNPKGKITPWQAMKSAEGKTGGHAFQALFEFDEGKWIYGIMVVKGHKITEVDVDAMTGVTGDTEEVTPDGEAKEVKDLITHVIAAGG